MRTTVSSLLTFLLLLISFLGFLLTMPPSKAQVIEVGMAVNSTEAMPGDFLIYTIYFNNTGDKESLRVWINDTLPNGAMYIEDTASLEEGVKTGDYNWTFSPVNISNHSFTVVTKINLEVEDQTILTNLVHLDYTDHLGFPLQGSLTSVTTIVKRPVLTLEMTANSSHGDPSDYIDYSIYFNNSGSRPASLVWIDFMPASQLNYVNDTSYLEEGRKTGDYNWTFSHIAPGPHKFLVRVQIDSMAHDGALLKVETHMNYSSGDDIIFQGGWKSFRIVVTAPVMSITKTANSDTILRNQILRYVIYYDNKGSGVAGNVWINDTIPSGLTFVNSSIPPTFVFENEYRWHFVEVEPGRHNIILDAKVNSDALPGSSLINQVVVNYTDANDNPLPSIRTSVSTLVIVPSPSISIFVTVDKTKVGIGDVLDYLFHFNNTGTGFASRVQIDVSIPNAFSYVSDTSAQEGGTRSGNTYIFRNVSPGKHSFLLRLKVNENASTLDEISLWTFLNYTNEEGSALGGSLRSVTVLVERYPLPFDYTPIVLGIIAIAFVSSGAVLFTRESSKYSLLIFFLPLYTRLKRERILDHETRGMIRGYILANPGDHFNGIKEALDVTNGTLAYHLRVLEREDIIKSVKDGKYRRFYPPTIKIPDEKEIPTKIQKMILEVIRSTPGISQKDIASLLNLTPATINYHIERLKEMDLIQCKKEGTKVRYYVKDRG